MCIDVRFVFLVVVRTIYIYFRHVLVRGLALNLVIRAS